LLKDASSTTWSGGIAGKHGESFYIEVKYSEKQKIVIDTLYIKGHTFLPADIYSKSITKDGFQIYQFSIGLDYSDNNYFPIYPPDSISPKPKKVQLDPGPNRIVYTFRNHKKVLEITPIRKNPPVNYP
jgi:hypothetical protein